jgi:CubicO group peptidase (beta-lactamase class C family)
VRVVDLLEHTTGWDEMHLREFARDAKGMTLREGLDYDHRSRISRWRHGTRMAYSNSGFCIVATAQRHIPTGIFRFAHLVRLTPSL